MKAALVSPQVVMNIHINRYFYAVKVGLDLNRLHYNVTTDVNAS